MCIYKYHMLGIYHSPSDMESDLVSGSLPNKTDICGEHQALKEIWEPQ